MYLTKDEIMITSNGSEGQKNLNNNIIAVVEFLEGLKSILEIHIHQILSRIEESTRVM